MDFNIGNKPVGKQHPVFFIADIASNHCGDLVKAKELIHACAESGVDAVKMQNFSAETIVSDYGFKTLGNVKTHQSAWKTSVFDSYKAASIPFEWTLELKDLTENLGMAYFTSPYSIELVHAVAPYVAAFKLGSGDITWHEEIATMATYDKPLLIATGAATMEEVRMAMDVALKYSQQVLLMQCNTNYTAKHGEPEELTRERFASINLKVLDTYARHFPDVPIGLSDHTHGSLTVLGAVGLYDCCAVEKHFTLDSSQVGQDHPFSMMPQEWQNMVDETAALKAQLQIDMSFEERLNLTKDAVDRPDYLMLAIGDGVKKLQANEMNTVIVQRRAIRAARSLQVGEQLRREDLVVLRPCPKDAFPPFQIDQLLGKSLAQPVALGEHIQQQHLAEAI